jgi:hypothetical protein
MEDTAINIAASDDAGAHQQQERAQRRWQAGMAKANPDITTPLLEETEGLLHDQKPAIRFRAVAGAYHKL